MIYQIEAYELIYLVIKVDLCYMAVQIFNRRKHLAIVQICRKY